VRIVITGVLGSSRARGGVPSSVQAAGAFPSKLVYLEELCFLVGRSLLEWLQCMLFCIRANWVGKDLQHVWRRRRNTRDNTEVSYSRVKRHVENDVQIVSEL
jgi:hypothetical protein